MIYNFSRPCQNKNARYFFLEDNQDNQTFLKGSDIDLNWWKPLISKHDLETIHPYSKFIMMFSILQECEEIGDKVLV